MDQKSVLSYLSISTLSNNSFNFNIKIGLILYLICNALFYKPITFSLDLCSSHNIIHQLFGYGGFLVPGLRNYSVIIRTYLEIVLFKSLKNDKRRNKVRLRLIQTRNCCFRVGATLYFFK